MAEASVTELCFTVTDPTSDCASAIQVVWNGLKIVQLDVEIGGKQGESDPDKLSKLLQAPDAPWQDETIAQPLCLSHTAATTQNLSSTVRKHTPSPIKSQQPKHCTTHNTSAQQVHSSTPAELVTLSYLQQRTRRSSTRTAMGRLPKTDDFPTSFKLNIVPRQF